MVWVSSEETSGRGDKREIRLGNQSEDEVINNCHIVGSRMFLEAGMVFMQRNIARIMQIVFNLPVRAKHV